MDTGFGILAILFWGSTIAFSRSLTEQLGTMTTGAIVFMMSALLSWFYLSLTTRNILAKAFQLPRFYLWGCGSLFITHMITLYLAIGLSLSRNQVIEISIINYLWPGLTLLFSVPVLKKKANLAILIGIMMGFSGIYIAMNPHPDLSLTLFFKNIKKDIIPYFFAFIAAISWALYSTLLKKWAREDQEVSIPVFLFLTGFSLWIFRFFFQEQSLWSPKVVLELMYVTIFPTWLAYSFWDRAMRYGNLILVATLSYFTPLLSVVMTSLYLQITLNVRLWVALIFIIIGAFISKFSIREI